MQKYMIRERSDGIENRFNFSLIDSHTEYIVSSNTKVTFRY